MASGTITLKTPINTVAGVISWSSTKGTPEQNYSLINVSVKIKKTDGFASWGTFSGKLTINGTSYSFSKYAELGSSYVTLISKTGVKVNHNSNGEKSITISTSFSNSGTTIAGSYSGSKSVAMDTIKRASTLSTPISITAGTPEKLIFNKFSASFVHDVTLKIGGLEHTYKGFNESINFVADFTTDMILKGLNGSMSKEGQIILTTKSGSTVVGSNTYPVTFKAPAIGTLSLSKTAITTAQDQVVSVKSAFSKYTYKIQLNFAGTNMILADYTGDAPAWTLTNKILEFAAKMPADKNSADCKVTVNAFYNGTQFGSTLTKEFTISLSDADKKINFNLSNLVCTFKEAALTGSANKFINHAGTLHGEIGTRATASHKAAIVSYRLTLGEKFAEIKAPFAATGNLIFDVEKGSGQVIELKITDSRGNAQTWTKTIAASDFINYTPLTLKSGKTKRENGFDRKASMELKISAWKGNFGVKENSLTIRYTVRRADKTTASADRNLGNMAISSTGVYSYNLQGDGSDGNFEPDFAYEISLIISDGISEIKPKLTLSSGLLGLFLKRNKENYHVGVNCRPDQNEMAGTSTKAGLSVKGDFELLNNSNQIIMKCLAADGALKLGNNFAVKTTKQGLNFVELDLGTHLLRMNWGRLLVAVAAENADKPFATPIKFAEGLFTEAPCITALPCTGVPGSAVKGIGYYNATNTGCNLYVYRTNAVDFYVSWKALTITKK